MFRSVLAFEMLLTGRSLSAEEAVTSGLINHAVAPEHLEFTVQQFAEQIASQPAEATALGKRVFRQQMAVASDLRKAYKIASEGMCDNLQQEQTKEGIQAFLQKRKPAWKSEHTQTQTIISSKL